MESLKSVAAAALAAMRNIEMLSKSMRQTRIHRQGPGRRTLYTYWKNVRLDHAPPVDLSPPNTRQRKRAAARIVAKRKAAKEFGSTRHWRRALA